MVIKINDVFKAILCLLILAISNNIRGQQYDLTNHNLFQLYAMQNDQIRMIEFAKYLYEQHKDVYTYEEYYAMGFGALFYMKVDPQYAYNMGRFSARGLKPKMESFMRIMQNATIEEKKESIINMLQFYEGMMDILSYFLNYNSFSLSLYNYASFFHNNVYKNRNLYFNNKKEAEYLLQVVFIERRYVNRCLYDDEEYDVFFGELLPEFIRISDSLELHDRILIYPLYKEFAETVGSNSHWASGVWNDDDILFCDKYVENRTNYYLKLKEFELNSLKCYYDVMEDYSKDYYSITYNDSADDFDWKKVQESLDKNEAALLLFANEFSHDKSKYYDGYFITSDCTYPYEIQKYHIDELITDLFSNTPRVYIEHKVSKRKYNRRKDKNTAKDKTKIEKIYVCPFGDIENIDIANIDERIVMKHSLSDIKKSQESSCYNNGALTFYGDIDYGANYQGDDIPKIQKDKELLSSIQNDLNSKVYALTGYKVNKLNFLNVACNSEIFHVSTHGDMIQNVQNITDIIGYRTSLLNMTEYYALALSGYNIDKIYNSISADDIKRIDMTGLDVVFLDACHTGMNNFNNILWGNNSLSKAFYIAGVSNIISNQNNIDETIAYDFASTFYHELVNDDVRNYHDVFYRVKKQIIEKYKNVLVKDKFGRPDLGIILWE